MARGTVQTQSDYKIISASSYSALVDAVNTELAMGYVCVGGVVVAGLGDYRQAVVMPKGTRFSVG